MNEVKKHQLEDVAYNAAEQLLKMERPQLELRTFLEQYLPILLDETQDRLSIWLGIAKTPFMRVDLMENGEVVDQVPPLQAPIETRMARSGVQSVYERVATIYAEAGRLPGRGSRYIEEKMKALLPENKNVDKISAEWVALIKKYRPDFYIDSPADTGVEGQPSETIPNNEIGNVFEEL